MGECNSAVRSPLVVFFSELSAFSCPPTVLLSDHSLLFVFLNLFLLFPAMKRQINFVNQSGHEIGLFPVSLEQNPPILVSFSLELRFTQRTKSVCNKHLNYGESEVVFHHNGEPSSIFHILRLRRLNDPIAPAMAASLL